MKERPDAQSLVLALTVSPRLVSAVRRFVEEVAERLGANADLSARMAMTTHELLENVAKYAEDRRGVLCLDAATQAGGRKLTVTVTNGTSAAHVDRLKQVFHEMESAPNPLTHYFMLMRREVGRDESGLGLARIRAEGEMFLSLSVNGSEVSLAATSEPFTPIAETEP